MSLEDVVEELVVSEETLDFDSCAFQAVGSVADVEHGVGAVGTTDGPFFSLQGVGGSKNRANTLNHTRAREHKCYHWAALHEVAKAWEKWLTINHQINDVTIMFLKDFFGELHHFHTTHMEPFGLKSLQYFATKIFTHAVRLKENEGFFVSDFHNLMMLGKFRWTILNF